MTRDWKVWKKDEIRRAFAFLVSEYEFVDDGDVDVWYEFGVRYHRGKLGIEIVLEAETGFRLAVWLRFLEHGNYQSGEQWSGHDIELSRFCEREGVDLIEPPPMMHGPAETEARVPPALAVRATSLRRILPLLDSRMSQL